jgi:hypothetical protein
VALLLLLLLPPPPPPMMMGLLSLPLRFTHLLPGAPFQETFHEIIAREQNKDKLTGFVVQTILTVDDFMLFKAMMVKRNIDLTNQVRRREESGGGGWKGDERGEGSIVLTNQAWRR